jgi:hypothetical protein
VAQKCFRVLYFGFFSSGFVKKMAEKAQTKFFAKKA